MQLKIIARALALVATALALAACQQFSPDNNTRTLSFNHSVAESTNQLLLLNIIRDSQRTPTYFSRLGSNSARSTLNSGLSFSFPFGTFSTGQASSSADASAENLLTLENLDDKKYQDGAMRTVNIETIQTFWNEGLQRDALGLLFVGLIEMPAAELPVLESAVQRICSDTTKRVGNKFCSDDTGESVCLTGIPLIKRNGVDYAQFINDPAWEYGVAGERGPARCFQEILRDLLALGLKPQSKEVQDEVDDKVPAGALKDGTFRSEIIKGGFKIAPNDDKTGTHVTKKSSQTVLAFDLAGTLAIRLQPEYRALFGCRQRQVDDYNPVTRKSTLSDARRKSIEKKLPESDGECRATRFISHVQKDFHDKTVIATADLKIDLPVRSFEGVVYYLGEVVRAETADLKDEPGYKGYYPTIVGRARWGKPAGADEPLFVVQKGAANGEAAIAVRDDHGDSYWIPGFCIQFDSRFPVSKDCGAEYPNHESLTVLTLVNQLWGMQKEPSTPPTPTINVGG